MSALPPVLIRSDALKSPERPVYHAYRNAGSTRCGRRFYIASNHGPGEGRMEFVHRRHATRIGRPCKRCFP